MKKIFSLIVMASLILLFSACTDAKYSDDRINVIFFTGGTASNATQIETLFDVEAGSLVERPDDPERPGYTFVGWFTDLSHTIPWNFETDTVGNTTIVLYAAWEAMTHNIIYDLSGGEFPSTANVFYTFTTGDRTSLPVPTKSGYTFIAWFTYPWVDESSTIPGDTGLYSIPAGQVTDLYIYAHWRRISVRVSFIANYPISGQGPASPAAITVNHGDIINFPVLADTDEYRFIGWNSNRTGTGTWYVNGDIFIRNQTLTVYGIWEEK